MLMNGSGSDDESRLLDECHIVVISVFVASDESPSSAVAVENNNNKGVPHTNLTEWEVSPLPNAFGQVSSKSQPVLLEVLTTDRLNSSRPSTDIFVSKIN